AAPEPRLLRETELPADLRERRGGHERRTKCGELALGRVGKAAIELLAHDEIDDRVAEELETLEVVRVLFRMLVEIRAVRQRVLEQHRIDEAIPADLDVGHLLHKCRKGRGSAAPASPTRYVRRDCAR